jgi:transcriptional regulator with XRE-family HTH domain
MQVACQSSVIVDVHSSRLNDSMINRKTGDVNPRGGPTIRRRRLGVELRRHREAAAATIDVAADRLGYSMSEVSRIETGHTGATAGDVLDMLDIYGVDDRVKDELVQIAREAMQKGWRNPFSTVLNSAYVGLEAATRSIRTYEQQVVPGLLPSEGYAIAMIRAARLGDTTAEIEQRVHVRMARQSLLTQDDPIDLRVVLDEAVLSRPVGGDEVTCDQLLRLIEAARLPNVTIQILPFAAGPHGGLFLEKAEELRKYDSSSRRSGQPPSIRRSPSR